MGKAAILGTAAGGGGGGLPIGPVPPVHITPDDPAATPPYYNGRVYWRTNHRVEIDVDWTPDATATSDNFVGVEIYIEDPDTSSATRSPMDGTVAMDGTAQTSGQWTPIFVNKNSASPAIIFPDNTMGGMQGASYRMARSVRIYLLSYGPHTQAKLVRATDPNPTPNVLVAIPQGEPQGQSGQEWTALVTNAQCAVTPDYNRPDPSYHLTFTYTPPDTSVQVPPGQNAFGGVRIHYLYPDGSGNYFDGSGNPINDADSGIDVPVAQSSAGYNSPVYTASAGGGSFRCYFCSEDDSFPTGMHINTLVQGVTPYCQVTIGAVGPAPDVSAFTIDGGAVSSGKAVWMVDGSVYLEAKFAWALPASAPGSLPYAGVMLYLCNVVGSTPYPTILAGPLPNVDTGFILDINNIPKAAETWTICAISVDQNNKLSDDPTNPTHSPRVTWNVAPPATGNAPLVTVTPGQQFGVTQSISTDGVGMVSFSLGPWVNPTDNKFGGLEVAMVVNNDPTKPVFWQVPSGATSFTTPAIPSFGNNGANVPVDFFLVSDDPQGHKNAIVYGQTPLIGHYSSGQYFQPQQGAVIPARSGWFDPTQFAWNSPAGGLQAQSISAQIVQVANHIVVGGGPESFGGMQNGQIAVNNASGQLIGWIGQQTPGAANVGTSLSGAWFKQLWVGGDSPLHAPIYVDNQGIIEVGGIAAQNGYAYPYISIRDSQGYEKGRIGASLNYQTGLPKDGTGSNPPNITAGAWFTQLAVGGSNISNWNILIVPDSTPLGSSVQMRNIDLFQIDYAASGVVPKSNQYRLLMGSSVWNSGGGAAQWQFPGMQIYEVDGYGGTSFGSTLLNRGLVLKGSYQQSYPVLASLVTFNGDSTGNDASNSGQFWAELTLYSPYSTPANQILAIDMASGQASSGDPYFRMYDHNANLLFYVDGSGNVSIKGVLQGVGAPSGSPPVAPGITATSYNAVNYPTPGANGQVIDAAGNWRGNPITGGSGSQIQSPWAGPIQGATYDLLNAGEIHGAAFYIGGSAHGAGQNVIDVNGNWLGGGVIKSVAGTAGQVNVSTAAGAATISLPNPVILNPGGLCLNQGNDGSGYQLQVYGGIEMTAADGTHNIMSKGTASNAIYAYGGGVTTTSGLWVSGYGQVINSAGNWVGPAVATAGVSSISGTAAQISASASTGAVTLSLPSEVHVLGMIVQGTQGSSQGNTGDGYWLQVWGGIEMAGPANFIILSKGTAPNAIYANQGGVTAHTGYWLEGTQLINSSGTFVSPGGVSVNNNIITGGPSAGFTFYDRNNSAQDWVLYAAGGWARLWFNQFSSDVYAFTTGALSAPAYNVNNGNTPVIDAGGNWVGPAIPYSKISGFSGVTAVYGTENQVNVSANTGAVTLSLPQNIHTGASPTFAGVTANGQFYSTASGGNNSFVNGSMQILGNGTIGTNSYVNAAQGYMVNGVFVINSAGQWVGPAITTGVTQIYGTVNQVNVSANTGSVTLSLPQNIHTGASPTFASVTANGQFYSTAAGGNNSFVNGAMQILGNGTIGTNSYVNAAQGFMVNGSYVIDSGSALHVSSIYISGQQRCTSTGVWTGSVQCYDNVFANQFGIIGVAVGAGGSFTTADGKTVTVQGGIITRIQ